MANDGVWIRFWDVVCDYDELLKAAMSIDAVLLLALLLASPGIERGSASFVILVFNVAVLVPLLAVTLYLILRCRRRERPERF